MPEPVSLLWPPGFPAASRPASQPGQWCDDLGLDYLVPALDYDGRHADAVRAILTALDNPPEVIRYRQQVLADLDTSESLLAQLADRLPLLYGLHDLRRPLHLPTDNELLQVVRRLHELELYTEAVRGLLAALEPATLGSPGLSQLRRYLAETARSEKFQRLVSELPALREAAEKVSSVTIGVNLDEEARPVAATLLSVNDRPFSGQRSLLARLLGRVPDDVAGAGIAPLHREADFSPSPFLEPLFRDLADVLRQVCGPIARALAHYVDVSVAPLQSLADEVTFYLGAARLAHRLRAAGLPLCLPEILPTEQRTTRVIGLYNVGLALRLLDHPPAAGQPNRPVPSDLDMGPQGRSFVLTGPNLGGKTTFVQAIGIAHVLAQAGLPVPGESALISPVDAIHTHFPAEEQTARGTGRLGEEAERLAGIFSRATPGSLVLLNESLASTSPGEALYLARDAMGALRLLGARTIYATHLHELATRLDELNALAPTEPPTVSLVAGVVPTNQRAGDSDLGRTYRIAPGPPQGMSYAQEVARRHGISLDQLRERLRQRGVGPAEE